MSSVEDANVDVTPQDVNWDAVFEGDDTLSTAQIDVKLSSQTSLDKPARVDLLDEAVDEGIITRTPRGYTRDTASSDDEPAESDATVDDEHSAEVTETDDESEDVEQRDQKPEPETMARDELVEEVDQLRDEVSELRDDVRRAMALTRQFQSKMETVEALLVGEDELQFYDAENITADPLHSRVQDIEEDVNEHDEQLAMVESGEATEDTPDGRARTLRQVCYNKAKKNEGLSRLTRDEADGALSGGLHRQTLMDAMKRAADGKDAEKGGKYTPINGSSDLMPQEGLEFVKGEDMEQSHLEFDADDLTSAATRQNLTTGGDR